MTYTEYISQFELLNKQVSKKGYQYHHIVPKAIQTEIDDRGILVTPAQHLWAHILYDKENHTHTACKLIGYSGIKKKDIHCYEDCLPFNDTYEEWVSNLSNSRKGKNNPFFGFEHTKEQKEKWSKERSGERHPLYGKHHSEETKKKISESAKGKDIWNKGTHWWTNGKQNKMSKECPGDGFIIGYTSRKAI